VCAVRGECMARAQDVSREAHGVTRPKVTKGLRHLKTRGGLLVALEHASSTLPQRRGGLLKTFGGCPPTQKMLERAPVNLPPAQITVEWQGAGAKPRRVDAEVVHSTRFCAGALPLEALLRRELPIRRPLDAVLRRRPTLSTAFCAGQRYDVMPPKALNDQRLWLPTRRSRRQGTTSPSPPT
jgi:hypothetical protein